MLIAKIVYSDFLIENEIKKSILLQQNLNKAKISIKLIVVLGTDLTKNLTKGVLIKWISPYNGHYVLMLSSLESFHYNTKYQGGYSQLFRKTNQVFHDNKMHVCQGADLVIRNVQQEFDCPYKGIPVMNLCTPSQTHICVYHVFI